jgi:hypothetical protein
MNLLPLSGRTGNDGKLGVRFEFETPPAKLLSFAMDLTLVAPATVVFSNAYKWPLGCTSSVGFVAC